MKSYQLINLLFPLMISLSTNAETIHFKNFNHDLTFEKNAKGYLNTISKQHVTVAHRLIVKTSRKYSKKKLAKTHKAIIDVKELYKGSNFNYFSAEIKKEVALSKVMKKLLKKRSVYLVQVDILQQTKKSHENKSHNHKNNLLKKPPKRIISKQQRKINREKQIAKSLPHYLKMIGVNQLWKKTKGKGVKIAVIDDGFDLKHKEFENTKVAFSYDVNKQSLNANPKHFDDLHGTKIAGVLFAKHDKKGVEGIAPEAEFIAIRQPDTWTSNTLLSFQLAKLEKADIINCSWNSPQLMQPIADVVNDLAKHGRNGKGTVVVFAAGNKGIEILPNSTEASVESAIVVGASNLLGQRALKFSNKGKSVDLLSFGRAIRTTIPDNKMGVFAQTSLAATIVSGVSALLLSQNPDLDLSQLKSELKKMMVTKNKVRELKNNEKSTKVNNRKVMRQEINNGKKEE